MWSAFNFNYRDTRAGRAIDSRREILPDGVAFTFPIFWLNCKNLESPGE
jgi:hypothetical protein